MGVDRVDDHARAVGLVQLVPDHVRAGGAVGVVEATDRQLTGDRDLRRVRADLDRRPPRAAVADRGQLVHAAQRRLVVARDELRPDAPAVDPGALGLEGFHRRGVEVVRGHDLGVLEPRRVEQLAGPHGQVREVARVEPDAGQLLAALAHPEAGRDRVRDAVLGVEGVDQQHGVAGHDVGPGVERLLLARERQDPASGRGSRVPGCRTGGRRARSRSRCSRRGRPPATPSARRRVPARGAARTPSPAPRRRPARRAPPWSPRASGSSRG